MKIQRMTENDLPEVMRLVEQLGYPSLEEDVQRRFKIMDGDSNYALFVATDESGKMVGYVQVNRETSTLLMEASAEVAALVVDASDRGKGIGAALLQHAEKWTREMGIGLLRLRSNLKRVDAHRFYERNGYCIRKSAHVFTKTIG